MDQIITAKERQAAEANKAANSLLKEIDLEKSREETRKVAAAKKREKRKAKKKGKQKTPPGNETSSTNATAASTTLAEQEQEDDDDDAEESNENEEPAPHEVPLPPVAPPQPPPPPPSNAALVVDDDLRLKMLRPDHEQTTTTTTKKSSTPEPAPLPSKAQAPSHTKKKTNSMSRKIERHQENLAAKTKQQETNTAGPTVANVDDGWQEVIGKQKKVTIPHEQYSRVIGRGGTNLNVLREVTGASIDVENKRAIGDKIIVIKYVHRCSLLIELVLISRGNGDAMKHAYQLIMALLKNSESELMSLLPSSSETKAKARSSTLTSNNEMDEETAKMQRMYTARTQPTGKQMCG